MFPTGHIGRILRSGADNNTSEQVSVGAWGQPHTLYLSINVAMVGAWPGHPFPPGFAIPSSVKRAQRCVTQIQVGRSSKETSPCPDSLPMAPCRDGGCINVKRVGNTIEQILGSRSLKIALATWNAPFSNPADGRPSMPRRNYSRPRYEWPRNLAPGQETRTPWSTKSQ